jgi:hypothetical protein
LPEEVDKAENAPGPANVRADIDEVNKSREAVEDVTFLCSMQAGAKGFSGVS